MKQLITVLILVLVTVSIYGEARLVLDEGSSLIFEYTLPAYQLSESGDYSRISAPSLAYDTIEGAPLLAYDEVKIGIPYGATISFEILATNIQTRTLAKPIEPGPRILERDGMSFSLYERDNSLYENVNRELIELLSEGSYRGYHFIPLRINPFRYDGDKSLDIVTSFTLRVVINGRTSQRNLSPEDSTADILINQLINGASSRAWYSMQRPVINFADFTLSDWWIKIETAKDGMHKINQSQLSAFPLNDVDPRTLRLFTTSGAVLTDQVVQPGSLFQEIPIIVSGEADGVFNGNDYILFFGASRDGQAKNQAIGSQHYYNPYSKTTVYWLTFGGSFSDPPKRIESIEEYTEWDQVNTTFRESIRLDEDRYRREVHGFEWYMTKLNGSQTADYQFTIDLPDLDPNFTQSFTMNIIQEDIESYLTHNMTVLINGVPVINNPDFETTVFSWANTAPFTLTRQVSSFQAGQNTITIRMIRTSTANYFVNYFQVDYNRLNKKIDDQLLIHNSSGLRRVKYELTGDTASVNAYLIDSQYSVFSIPIQQNGAYLIAQGVANSQIVLTKSNEFYSPLSIEEYNPVNLTAFNESIDNIIIYPSEFRTKAEELSSFYENALGINSLVVDQQDIFNQFNGGHPDPVAIRQFLRYLYHNLPSPAISSLTLLGLGSIDWVNNSGQAGQKNRIIVFQEGYYLSDDWFGFLTNENYPEIAIGRYPVKNTNELDTMLNNLRNYIQDPIPGYWRNSLVFLADDLYNGPNSPYEDKHTRQIQEAANLINPSIYIDKIFAWDYPYDEFQNKPGARDAVINSVNDGKLLWLYMGHGSYDKIGTEDYFNGASDLGRLSNNGKLPFFIAGSCKVSNFDYWGFDSLAQKLVLKSNQGAIATWSATRISFPDPNAVMINALMNRMLNQRMALGSAILATKISYTQNSLNEAVYVLLGDPLVNVIPPERSTEMHLSVDGIESEELRSRQLASVSGSFTEQGLNGSADLYVFNTDDEYMLDNVNVSHRGDAFFKAKISINNADFTGSFVVPDDITNGDTGSIVAYHWNASEKKDYTSYLSSITLSDDAVAVQNNAPPEIELFLSSWDYRPGDTVGDKPVLLARISDDNGINITGSAGHNILLIIDGSVQPISITSSFNYDQDSYTTGTVVYQLPELSPGPHSVQLIAFDNFNLPSVASTDFEVKKSGNFTLERFLIYPNPMTTNTNLTFLLSENADLEIGIYTMRGTRIRTISVSGRQGFNSIPWDGKDARGSKLANNTYFIKIKAISQSGETTEKIERLVIYN